MLDREFLQASLPQALAGIEFDAFAPKTSGKVRDIYHLGNGPLERLALVTTDRLSAFDHVLGLVPFKGQVLNQLSTWWFSQTRDIIANHWLATPDPNVMVVRRCTPLAVEVVVRGYITGVTETALWHRYSLGERSIYGISFPDGLNKNDALPAPVITPTTKAAQGGHDQRITAAQVVARGLTTAQQWAQITQAALALFTRGQKLARQAGLILVDTKYEFGLAPDGAVTLIDEVHTPDSSRFWLAGSYAERIAVGQEPENFDKEFIRLFYVEHGYRGDGEPMPLPSELAVAAAERYISIYERLTGQTFVPGALPAQPRIEENLRTYLAEQG